MYHDTKNKNVGTGIGCNKCPEPHLCDEFITVALC
jgi:hypothetical protein